MQVKSAESRGKTKLDWLVSRHTFSFGDYYDPQCMGFGPLRVINDDVVKAGHGFGMHGHRDMEIVTVVVSGALEHRDSLGNGEVLRPGDVQVMSAGSGIRHSEWNPSPSEEARFLQMWIEPKSMGGSPRYAQRAIDPVGMENKFSLIVSGLSSTEALLTINQDANISRAHIAEGTRVSQRLADGHKAWLQIINGCARLEGVVLEAGDGVAVAALSTLEVIGLAPESDLLLFVFPPF